MSNEYNNTPVEENPGGSTGLGREAKIGVSVIAILAIVLGVVVVMRLSRSGSEEKIATTTTPGDAKKAANPDRKNNTLLKNNRTKQFGSASPTIVSARAASTTPPKTKAGNLNRQKFASNYTRKNQNTRSGASPGLPPRFAPDPPRPPHPDRSYRYASDSTVQNADNNTRLVIPGDDSSGYSLAEPTPPVPAYRDYSRYRSSQASPSQTGSSHAASNPYSTPAMPVGQYDTRQYGRDASSRSYNPVNTRRSRSASLYGNPPPRRGDGKYEVQPNDSYWTISETLYGTGAYFKALARHNRGTDHGDDQLQPGELILAPEVAALEKSYPDLCPKPNHREAMIRQSQASTVSTQNHYRSGRSYTVVEGDTLFNIARYELGKASRWAEIYDLNRDVLGKDFHYLTPGAQLVMPEGEKSDVIAEPRSNVYRR